MRFRFTIRDLLWLTALVAVLLAWWLDRRQIQATNAEIQAKNAEIQAKNAESNLNTLKTGIEILKEGGPNRELRFRLKE